MSNITISQYPGGFASGVTIRGVPIAMTHPGQIFWVYNGTVLDQGHKNGSNGNKGTFTAPYATINYAITQCRANKGDIIFVKPGHTEALAAAGDISCGVAGVAIIGLGVGSMRPTITLGTLTTASIKVAAANVTWANFLFVSALAAVATVFEVATTVIATDLALVDCEFRDGSTALNLVSALVQGGTTANALDGLYFYGNTIVGKKASAVTAATTAVVVTGAMDRAVLSKNVATHRVLLANTAVLLAMGANDLTNVLMDGNMTYRPNTSNNTGELLSSSSTASSGLVTNNICMSLSANGLVIPTGTKLGTSRNFAMITGATDKSALENPAAV